MIVRTDFVSFYVFWLDMTSNENAVGEKNRVPKLNERILSSLSRRSVAAHPWHDLEIGTCISVVTLL